jgi:hypothetical protein
MSNNFFYEDGQGNIADEQGNEAIDYEEEMNPFNVGSLLTASRYSQCYFDLDKGAV